MPIRVRLAYLRSAQPLELLLYVALVALGAGLYAGVALNTVSGGRAAVRIAWVLASLTAIGGSVALAQVARGRLLLGTTVVASVALVATAAVGMGASLAVLLLAWLGLIAAGVGDLLLVRVGRSVCWSGVERVALGLLLGLGSLGFLFAVVATFQLLHLPVMLAALVVVSVPALQRARDLAGRWQTVEIWEGWRSADLRAPAVALAWLALCLGGAFLWACAPAVQFDAVWYHLPVAQFDALNGGFSELPYYGRWRLIGLSHTLYSVAFVLVGQPLPALLHWLAAPVVAALLWSFGRRMAGPMAGWLAAALFASMPLAEWEAGSSYIDLFVTAFFSGAVYVVARWWVDRRPGLLVVGGLLGGMAIGAKLNAGLLLVPLAAIVVVGSLARAERCRGLLGFFVPMVLVPVPWFFRSWVDLVARLAPFVSQVSAGTGLEQETVWLRFGQGTGLFDLLRLPLDLIVNGDAFDEIGVGPFGIVPLLWLAMPLLFGRARERRHVPLLVVALGGLLLWFRSVQVARYLFPLMPVLVVLTVAPLPVLREYVVERRVGRYAALAASGLLVLYVTSTRMVQVAWGYQLHEGYPVRLALGLESRDHFLARALPTYPAFQAINQDAGAGARVLSAGIPFHLYLDGELEDSFHSPEVRRLAIIPPGPGLAQALAARGYTHILVDREIIAERGGPGFVAPQFLAEYARPLFTQGDLQVYRFLPEGYQS